MRFSQFYYYLNRKINNKERSENIRNEKHCISCGELKQITEFYNKNNCCKTCWKDKVKKYHKEHKDNDVYREKRKRYKHNYDMQNKKTKSGWYTNMYNNMKQRNKKKFSKDLPFTKQEFIQWIENNYKEKFDLLFKNYLESDCDKYLAPSIDRIDDYDSYHFGNMQLITWRENDLKGSNSIKTKVTCAIMGKKCGKTVIQYDEYMNELMRFSSTHEVTRILGFDSSLIAKACREGFKSKGYYWKYL